MGRDATPDYAAAEPLEGDEERVRRVGAATAGGQHEIDRIGTPGGRGERCLDGDGVIGDVVERDDARPDSDVLAKGFGRAPVEYAEVARQLGEENEKDTRHFVM